MKWTAAGCVICILAIVIANSPWARAAEELVEVVPAVSVSAKDHKILEENNKMVLEHQETVIKLLKKQGLEVYRPHLPQYHIMSTNSVQALINQFDYAALARKLSAPIPAKPELKTGSALNNNLFLNAYNNALLRSIAGKLSVKLPEEPNVGKGSLAEQNNVVIKQNGELLTAIALKLGTSKSK
ncbi:MAG: hypothetical protein K2W95_16405 [Candidatus Obscuribacterales bacterium]|nr:hypothetical protein [Candidatus Obscuribacterales bacterium]